MGRRRREIFYNSWSLIANKELRCEHLIFPVVTFSFLFFPFLFLGAEGFCWIQIKSEVHVFGVEDALHPQRDTIYQVMDKIWKEIKKMGFVPDMESVLHDLDNEVKEQILRHHSEKLAIAFGLINTPEKSTLRIMKNLRVCNDCHSAIKFISKLVEREIILRDATRFHHFKGGLCSCRDYW